MFDEATEVVASLVSTPKTATSDAYNPRRQLKDATRGVAEFTGPHGIKLPVFAPWAKVSKAPDGFYVFAKTSIGQTPVLKRYIGTVDPRNTGLDCLDSVLPAAPVADPADGE